MEIYIDGKKLNIKVADDAQEREKGLMGLSSLDGYDGMLFIFENIGEASFWNKDTLLDLDLIWIKEERVVGVDFLPSVSKNGLKSIQSPEAVNMVLEVEAGQAELRGITKGSLVSIPPRLK